MIRWALVLAVLAAGGAASARTVTLGYAELADDPRYANGAAYAGIAVRTLGPAYPGALVGIEDAEAVGGLLGLDIRLLPRAAAPDLGALIASARGWARGGASFILADLPADALLALADALADRPVLIFNLTAPDDALRAEDCRANIVHVAPSYAMLADALTQFLVDRGWSRIALLVGERPEDALLAAAMRRAAAKYRTEIVAEAPVALTLDPRRRGESNVALLTAGIDADIYAVIDASGEFDRYVPYRTALPRPVVGTTGLTPHAWHWAWNRNGAPQLQHRFEALALPRRMNDGAWAAWVAVKAVMQAAMRSDPGSFEAMRAFLLGPDLRLDGAKGNPMNVRPWDQQLRQPILLATSDAVLARAPLEPFEHRLNDLDTLGVDAPETACDLGRR